MMGMMASRQIEDALHVARIDWFDVARISS